MTGTRSSRAACALILSGLVAGFVFALTPDIALGASVTNECLTSPKGAIAKGERWFYRVERGTQRRCWHTRAESSRKLVERTPSKPPEKVSDPAPLNLSVANARAEADLSPPPLNAAPREVVPPSETNARTWTLAERWSDRVDTFTPAPPPTMTTIQRAVVEAEPVANTDDTLRWLIDVLSVAAALAGVTVLLIALLVRRRRQPLDDDIELLPLTNRNGQRSSTWYEPPIDRLRMARHLAELPRMTS